MNNLEQYRQAKASIESLHALAKKDLLARFQELTREIFQVQRELREDFGVRVTVPTKPPKQAKQPRKRTAAAASVEAQKTSPPQPVPPKKESPEIARLVKKLETARNGLAAATDPRKSTALRDRVYELEDELHLLREQAS